MRQGNPNLPTNPYQPQRTGYGVPNNPQTYAQQVNMGRTQPQPNQAGYGGGTNTTGPTRMPGYPGVDIGMPGSADGGRYGNAGYGRGGYAPPPPQQPVTTQPVPNPAPTTPLPYDMHNPATWWWRQTPDANGMVGGYNTNAVPMGNFPQPTQGMETWLNPNTGLHQYGPGQGFQMAPPGSPVAMIPRQQFPQMGGFNLNDVFRSRFGY